MADASLRLCDLWKSRGRGVGHVLSPKHCSPQKNNRGEEWDTYFQPISHFSQIWKWKLSPTTPPPAPAVPATAIYLSCTAAKGSQGFWVRLKDNARTWYHSAVRDKREVNKHTYNDIPTTVVGWLIHKEERAEMMFGSDRRKIRK